MFDANVNPFLEKSKNDLYLFRNRMRDRLYKVH